MKTATINNHPIAPMISTHQQRGAWSYQRKPSTYPAKTIKGSFSDRAQSSPKALTFREILEREMGGWGSKKTVVGAAAKAETSAEAETTQFLTGYWA
ncbi:MAG TPA: hypothetical protein PLY93_11295 [Turneriella sp.]|nr:hypothetical protein [Turneriella sp.]